MTKRDAEGPAEQGLSMLSHFPTVSPISDRAAEWRHCVDAGFETNLAAIAKLGTDHSAMLYGRQLSELGPDTVDLTQRAEGCRVLLLGWTPPADPGTWPTSVGTVFRAGLLGDECFLRKVEGLDPTLGASLRTLLDALFSPTPPRTTVRSSWRDRWSQEQLHAWGGDTDQMDQEAITASLHYFFNTDWERKSGTDRHGRSVGDFVDEAHLKMHKRCESHGVLPSRPLLWWCVRKAGLDLRRLGDGPGGLRGARKPSGEGRYPPEAGVLGDPKSVDQVRDSLHDDSRTVVSLSGASHDRDDAFPIDLPAVGDYASTEDLAVERAALEELPDQLRQLFFTERPQSRRVASWPNRVAWSELCGRVAVAVVVRAATSSEFALMLAQDPRDAVWVEARKVPGAFPGWETETLQELKPAVPRRGNRLIGEVLKAISAFLGEDPAA